MLYRSFSADDFIASCRSPKHFQTSAAALPPASRDSAFARLAQLYLRTSPVYRNLLDTAGIWTAAEAPADVRRRLRLPDTAIDLVARTREGEFWVVGARFVAPDAALSARDVAAFGKAVRACRDIAHALLIHTASDPVHGLGKRTGQIALAEPESLDQAGWRRIREAAKGRIKRPEAKTARKHQVRAVADAKRHFRDHDRGRLVMPCGTGKTLVGTLIGDAIGAKTVVVAAPSLGLIRQNLAGWAEQFDATGRTFDCLCVCSDQTVGAGGDERAEDASDLGVEVTTDAGEIAARLKRPRKRPLVVFTTYQSSPLLAAGARKAKFEFDLGILDEAHKTVGASDRAFATLLDGDLIRIRKRVSMTATERVYRGDRDDVLSMDDEDAYGACFHQLSFRAAIEQKLICDYKVITFFVGESRIRELIEERAKIKFDDKTKAALEHGDAMSLAAGIAVKQAIRDHGARHIISFHRSIRDADNFRKQQDELNRFARLGPPVTNLHVSGRFSAKERARVLEQYASSEIGLVTNAKCLTEGIDVPSTDGILFEGPKQSVVDIAQAAGRAMRLSPGKKYGYIIVPVVVPDDMSFEEFAEQTEFKKVARTLAALSTQDERLAAEFRAIAEGRPPKGGIVTVAGEVPRGVGMEFGKFASAVKARVWATLGRANWRPYEEARAYARTTGIVTSKAWRGHFVKSGRKPPDVPATPDLVYAGKGWVGWNDFLGTEKAEYRSYEDARSYARTLGLKTSDEWFEFAKSGKKPKDIPSFPHLTYADEWQGYPDWIDKHWRTYRSFEEARAFVQGLGLAGVVEWRAYAKSGKKPADIPFAPDQVYADDGWVGYSDWVGIDRTWRPYEEARAYVHSLGLGSMNEWGEFSKSGKRPADIPGDPRSVYAGKGWTDSRDWLGMAALSNRAKAGKWRPFEEARAYARALGLKSGAEWNALAKSGNKPQDIPANPSTVYAGKGWKDWADWLGKQHAWRSYKEARAYVHTLGLGGIREWLEFCKSGDKPADIPAAPSNTYAGRGWKDWADWLGKGPAFRPFREARAYARSLGLKSQRKWRELPPGKRPVDIPAAPHKVYAGKGWTDWDDFLGEVETFRPFREARAFVHTLGLGGTRQWYEFSKSDRRPPDIPGDPRRIYAGKGWKGWADWLGKGPDFRSFREARAFARTLGLKTGSEWRRLPPGRLPPDVPRRPDKFYAGEGWRGWDDFLGAANR